MRQLKVLSVALMAIFALGITATSALALPDVHILATESIKNYPLHLNFADNGITPTKFEGTAGGEFEGKGLSILLLSKELSALGSFSTTFLNVKRIGGESEKCATKGSAAGEVLIKGEYHVVYIELSPLKAGVAFLLESVSMICAKATIKLKGCLLSTAEGAGGEDVTSITGKLEGKEGKNTLTEYYNDTPVLVKCILESSIGGIFNQSDEVVGEPIKLLSLPTAGSTLDQMFTILSI